MIDTKGLRCWIGWLGMALPIIVCVLSVMFGYGIPDSISATYFLEPCITPFMIILGMSGVLLFCYKGYDPLDNVLNTLAGLFALGICFFPCAATSDPIIGTFQFPADISNILHMVSAIGFFGILSCNSLFQFTKGSDNPTPNKKKRNIIFRVCGFGMITSFVALIPFSIFHVPHAIWLIETIALFFFGISWLTKANCYYWLFADEKEKVEND